jgi:transcriptional regulator with XRE-family HTH domain
MTTRSVRRRLTPPARTPIEDVYAQVGKLIRARRMALGLTIEQMAEACSIHRNRFADWELGLTRVPIHRLRVAAEALKCATADLLPDDDHLPVPFILTATTADLAALRRLVEQEPERNATTDA